MTSESKNNLSIIRGRLLNEQQYASLLDKRVDELVMETARNYPDRMALLESDKRAIRYLELATKIGQLRAALMQLGIKAGDGVAIYMPKCADNVIAMLATWEIGSFVVVLQDSYPTNLLEEVIGKTRPKAIICLSEWENRLPVTHLEQANSIILHDELRLLVLSNSQNCQVQKQSLDNLALLMFSTGTTGKPKTISITHRYVTNGHFTRAIDYPFEPGEVQAVNVLFVWEVLHPLIFGGTALIITDQQITNAQGLFDCLVQFDTRRFLTTPSVLQSLLSNPNLDWKRLEKHIRLWLLCGERVNNRTIHDFYRMLPEVKLINAYGIWECSEISLAELSKTHANEQQAVSVGKVCDGVTVAIIDPETLTPVPQGETGELWVGGLAIANGYHDDPALTQEKFVEGTQMLQAVSPRWFRTNDLARWRLYDGEIEVIGRLDFTVKVRGFTINTMVVEQAILDLNGVSLCAVIPVMNAKTDTPQTLAAYLSTQGHFETIVSNCRQELPNKLPHFAVPTFYLPLPDNCLTGGDTKKLDRSKLPRQLSLQDVLQTAKTKQKSNYSENELRNHLLEIFARHLEVTPSQLSTSESFFEQGVNSLTVAAIVAELEAVQNVELFEHVTIDKLVAHLSGTISKPTSKVVTSNTYGDDDIAIIGMAGRFPGAENINEFWQLLRDGIEASTELDDALLRQKGIPESLISHPDYIKKIYKVDNVDCFDAGFWGIGDKEALRMDPQHRLFLETAYAAIENAGIAPHSLSKNQQVGVFATCGIDAYLVHHQQGGGLKEPNDPHALLLTELGSEKDHVAMRLSYLLDLKGPSMAIGCGCASAQVSVSLGAQAIRAGECDCAITGASFVSFPQLGYLYDEGLPWSKDGRIRPFDRHASGTVLGDCVCVVVLKRLENALADGDPIWAILKGYATAHDGHHKASYVAPSVPGIANVVEQSLKKANTPASDISFIEFHGSATTVGDAIEFRAISEGLRAVDNNLPPNSIAIGSLKGNIGNPNCAGGIAGLIKTALMLTHRTLVPTIHYTGLSPQLSVDGTPLYVNDRLQPWESTKPRRASINTIGMGGTNCHMIVEEHFDNTPSWQERDSIRWHILPFSAKTRQLLDDMLKYHADFLQQNHHNTPWQPALLDVAFTLQTGRDEFIQRAFAVVYQNDDLDTSLQESAVELRAAPISVTEPSDIIFVFPGHGGQFVDMGRELYTTISHYRHTVDECCLLLLEEERLGEDLRSKLWSDDSSVNQLHQPSVLQPALFVLEYAMAMLLLELGLKPIALAGHSVGEITAATVGGWISLPDALTLIAKRAIATEQEAPEGVMLSVSLADDDISSICHDEFDLAAINSPEHQVLSTNSETIDTLEKQLAAQNHKYKRLKINRPFHSRWMSQAAHRCIGLAPLSSDGQRLPVTSNVTGGWLDETLLLSGKYWAQQLRQTVRWADNVNVLLQLGERLTFVEVGPGRTLNSLISACTDKEVNLIASMRHAKDDYAENQQLLTALGQLWCTGTTINWHRLHQCTGSVPRRIPLPGYRFQPTSYWLNPEASSHVYTPSEAKNTSCISCSPTAHKILAKPLASPLIRFTSNTQRAHIRLFCFPWAGGSARLFESWAATAGSQLDIIAVEPSGTGTRADEALLESDHDDLMELDKIEMAIRSCSDDNVPFVLVGLSLGAIICLELALTRLNDLVPHQLIGVFVCGKEPPPFLARLDDFPDAVTHFENGNDSYNLTDDQWLKYTEKMRGRAEPINPVTFKDFMLPRLRSDMRRDYRSKTRVVNWLAQHEGLRCTLGVYHALQDEYFPLRLLPDWMRVISQNCSDSRILLRQFVGEHAFISTRFDDIFQKLQADLATLPKPSLTTPLYQVRWFPIPPTLVEPSDYMVLNLSNLEFDPTSLSSRTIVVLTSPPETFETYSQWLTVEEQQSVEFLKIAREFSNLSSVNTKRFIVVLPSHVSGSLIVGISKTMAQELPELSIVRVFVPSDWLCNPDRTWLDRIVATAQSNENDIWYRDKVSTPVMARLSPMSLLTNQRSLANVLDIPSDGTVLITGGSGVVGTALIDWLLSPAVGLQPKQIVLLSRREHPTTQGVQVIHTDITSMDTLVSEPKLNALRPSLIFHLAGDIWSEDSTHFRVDQTMMRTKLVPKVAILSLLQAANKLNWPLRTVVNFSSTASLLGLAGSAAYSGANAFLDQLGTFGISLKNAGISICTINWGNWQANWQQSDQKIMQQSAQNGETPLGNDLAFAALATVLQTITNNPNSSQWMIADIQWQNSINWCKLPIVSGLIMAQQETNPIEPNVQAPHSINPEPQKSSILMPKTDNLQQFLMGFVNNGNGSDDLNSSIWDSTIADIGLDSLDMVEIRTQFQKQFQVVVPMSHFLSPHLTLQRLHDSLMNIISN